jgi:hypothetical protein
MTEDWLSLLGLRNDKEEDPPVEEEDADKFPQAHFGSADEEPMSWRDEPDVDDDPDDEEIETPEDVIEMLGFDPRDEAYEDEYGEDNDDEPRSDDDTSWTEADHPRDQDGKFARTAEGATAGRDYHQAQYDKYVDLHEIRRPHARAVKRYQNVMDLHAQGRTVEANLAHVDAEIHGLEGIRRVERDIKRGKIGGQPTPPVSEKKPEPARRAVPSNRGDKGRGDDYRDAVRELDLQNADDERYRSILSTGAKDRLKKGETWRDRVLAFAEQADTSDDHSAMQEKAKNSRENRIWEIRSSSISLHEAISNKSETEKDYHETAWHDATPLFKHVLKNARKTPVTKIGDGSRVSHYSPSDHEIRMDASYNSEDRDTVWRHEYGHAIDYDGMQPKSFSYDKDRQKDAEIVIKTFGGMTRGSMIGLRALVTAHADRADISGESARDTVRDHNYEVAMFADFLGAMTKNTVGWGHSNEYYERDPKKACAEMFANYVCLTQGKRGKTFHALLHAIAPKSCAAFERILEKVALKSDQ